MPNVKISVSDKIEPIVAKKRGRKPKGGKIITVLENTLKSTIVSNANVIVHLKCRLIDLVNNDNDSSDNIIKPESISNYSDVNTYEYVNHKKEIDDSKNIHEKVKNLQKNLQNNIICETTSSCFWCTYNFNNIPISIPKYEIENTYHVYGCFCSPECSVAYLMNENIDESIKFERYQLVCYIYSKIYNYKENIRPAPNPHYTLKKFFGNLTIDEYRKLSRSNPSTHHLYIIDKPIFREIPELHIEIKHNNTFDYNTSNQPIVQSFSA